LPALSLQGIIAVDIMEGSCTKEKFREFIISNVVCKKFSYYYNILLFYDKSLLFFYQVPQMNSYPDEHSVLILDNAQIHHDNELIEYIEAFGGRVEFLPPYSPDFNPIETCFSVIKSFLKKHRDFVHSCSDAKYPLLVACSQITSQMAMGFFENSIYM